MTAMVAAASLINLNTFPLMAWHTIDGITLTACGAWALDAGLRGDHALAQRGGLALLGCAVFVKQSFTLAAVIGVLWLVLHPTTRAGALVVAAAAGYSTSCPSAPSRSRAWGAVVLGTMRMRSASETSSASARSTRSSVFICRGGP